jgi:hypothetical protein
MDIGTTLKAFAVSRNPTAEGTCNLFGELVWRWIEDEKLSPDGLQDIILENRPVLLEILSKQNMTVIGQARNVVAQVVPQLDKNVHYALVIHRVSDHSKSHALALMLHHQWLTAQMDSAIAWLLQGNGSAEPAPQ